MALTRCKSCGGEYDPVQSDGYRYFHACAPVWDDSVKRDIERANKRDENVVVTGIDTTGKAIVAVKSAGAGAELVAK